MHDPSGINQELLEENALLKQRIQELELSDSDRERAEEALRESDERYRTLVENASDIVYRTDENGYFTFVNPALLRVTGYEAGEIIGKHYKMLVRPDIFKKAITFFADQLIKGIQNTYYEYPIVTKDGHELWFGQNLQLIMEEDHVTGFQAVARNITEQKAAEEAMRESEEKYRLIFEHSPLGHLFFDEKGVIIACNNNFVRQIGSSREALIGLNMLNLPDKKMVATIQKALSGCTVLYEGVYHSSTAKKVTPTRALFAPMISEGGRILGGVGIIEDITDRKQAEEALRESEEKHRNLFENANEAMFVAQDGKLVFLNPRTAMMTGYSSEELQSGPFIEFIHPDDREMVIDRHVRRMKGEALPHRYSFRIIHRDGAIRWVELNAVLINWDGKAATLNFMSDITDRRQAKEEKRILEERLQLAEKMESIGTLAGGIAHDFNNLLMGIQGYASLMLLDLNPSDPHYERLKRIEEQVQSGADLTRQLLGFARGGRYEVKPTDMNDIMKKTSSMFGRTKKEITIHRKYGKDLRTVEVDQGQMEQVFMNLYVNAWQAMPGGGEIYLETENVPLNDEQAFPHSVKPGKYVKITVTDTGTGMDEKTKDRIFDPFFTTKEMGRGTGLGLATVYGIIKGHKGMIDVESEPGQGTTFTIYLPASEKEAAKEKTAAGTIARGAETILLVDDEKMVVEVTRKLLESMGYRVYAAGSGQEAIAVYMEKRNAIDLVILDMIMPGLSGGETFDRLREIDPEIRVLLSSGYSIEGEAQHILNRGCNGFIQKPGRSGKSWVDRPDTVSSSR
jgi:two-component system cell cycle sensor histidine kinase/response regulator CckA